MLLSSYIPEDVLNVYNVEKLSQVFSRLQTFKNVEIDRLYSLMVNTGLASNELMGKQVSELLGTEVPCEVPKAILTNLIRVSSNVLKFRGASEKSSELLRALTNGYVLNNFSSFYSTQFSYISLSDESNGLLPTPEDISNGNVNYLYSSEEEAVSDDFDYNVVIISAYSKFEGFRNFVSSVFLNFIINPEGDTERFNFYFYDHTLLHASPIDHFYSLDFTVTDNFNSILSLFIASTAGTSGGTAYIEGELVVEVEDYPIPFNVELDASGNLIISDDRIINPPQYSINLAGELLYTF